MSYAIDLHPLALQELQDSYEWYEDRLEGLGKRFLGAIQQSLTQISAAPQLYSKRKGNYRSKLVDGFPFEIVYEQLIRERTIFVSYIFHTKRNPRLKYKR